VLKELVLYKKNMPKNIKIAILALIISLVSTLMAVYVDGQEFEELSFNDPVILGTNIIWALIIAWVIWDLCRGKGIKWTLILVGLILLGALIWETINFGFGVAQSFYALEIIMFVVAYFCTESSEGRRWFEQKSL